MSKKLGNDGITLEDYGRCEKGYGSGNSKARGMPYRMVNRIFRLENVVCLRQR